MTDKLYLIEKRGLYYRPDAKGYTGRKCEAGRYSFADAAERVGPNGPDGPQDGMGIWRESDAPDHSTSCPWDIKMQDTFFRRGYEQAVADLEAHANAFPIGHEQPEKGDASYNWVNYCARFLRQTFSKIQGGEG